MLSASLAAAAVDDSRHATPADVELGAALARLARAERSGHASLLAEAWQRLTRCYRALDERPTALAALEQALRWARGSGASDQALDLQCELVELLAEHARAEDHHERGAGRPLRERARDLVFDAARRAARCADPRWEVTVLLRLADVLDGFGDRDDATLLQVRALKLTVGVDYEAGAPRAEDAARLRVH